jgi:hypothetical protein
MNMRKKSKNLDIRRLILAKKLYLHGCSHSFKKDEISRMLAIHNFDNAIEMILKCIATKYNIVSSSKREFKFKDLWDEIQKKDINLPLKDQLFCLHDQRNIVQHQGDVPSLEAIIKYKGYVEDFFSEITKKEFGVSYDKLYLSELIENNKLREKIQKAEKAFGDEKYKRCIELCDDAFIAATFEEGDVISIAGMLTGYWSAGDELKKVISNNYVEEFKEKDFYSFAKDISKAILQLGQASTTMQFLDEYRKEFLEHRETIKNMESLSDEELKDRAKASLNFVTDITFKWQEEGILRK